METRGRSRHISPAAYARANKYNHTQTTSTTPTIHTIVLTTSSAPTPTPSICGRPATAISVAAGCSVHAPQPVRAALPATPTTPRRNDVSSDTYHSSVRSFSSTMWLLPRTPSPDPKLGVASSSRLMLPSATASCFNIPNNLDEFLDYSPSCSPYATVPSGPLTPPDSESSEWDKQRYCDSPPPLPPKSIQDQMQDAYALDNMHLAKVLLLKLRGIEVTSDDDPRIEEIQDADFSDAFVPPGGLQLSPEDEERYQEGLRREREHRRRVQREARLRACEKVWESSARCLREEKVKVTRRKEDEMKERRRMEIEARGREREAREREIERQADTVARYTRQLKVSSYSNQRTKLSYGSLPVSATRSALLKTNPPPPTFQYAVMPPVHTLASARHFVSPPSSPPKGKSPLDSPHRAMKELTAMNEQTISFATVVTRMHGPLFPEDDEDNDRDGGSGSLGSSGSGSVRRLVIQKRTAAQMQLFEDLLKRDVSQWEERSSLSTSSPSERPKVVAPRRKSSAECPACSLSLASTTTLVPSPSIASAGSSHTLVSATSNHRNSWFSSISSILSTPSLVSSSSVSSTSSALPSTPTSSPILPRATTSHPNNTYAKPSAIPSSSSIPSSSLQKEPSTRFVHTHHTCEHSKLVPLSSTDFHPLSPPSPSPLGYSTITLSQSPARPRGRPLTRTSTLTSTLTVKPSHLTTPAVRSSSSPSPTPTQGEREGEGLVWKMSQGLSRFVSMAAQFQRAYVKATMFSAGSDLYSERDWGFADSSTSRSYSRSRSQVRSEEDIWASRGRTREKRGSRLRPQGYRVSPIDVHVFLSDSSNNDPTPNRPLLPLNTLSSSDSPTSNTRPLRFPQPPAIPRSPFRSEPPPHELTQRFRPIANPLLLRMRAVQNVVCARAGVRLEDGNLREKVVGVAWDGIGRSGLGWENRFCSCGETEEFKEM
ncbi:hypothetical protein QCA50_010161 [Cerrena zonata]|uniref:Uncharacterized protein n=1 Tax=Cerrena zonata TaxID=2478898 RepID=A0AAW0G0L1_9APHY